MVELIKDVSVRVTPLSREDAAAMIRELKTFPLLEGYRGSPRRDVAALEDVILRIGALVEDIPSIAELDLNPVLVHESGATIVDARIRVISSATTPDTAKGAARPATRAQPQSQPVFAEPVQQPTARSQAEP